MTSVPLPVLTAVTGPWEAPLVRGLDRGPGGVQVVRRCADLAELLAAAAAGLGAGVVVSADLPRFDGEALARLEAAGVAVVVLVEPGDRRADQRVRLLGVDCVLPADAPPEEVARAVRAGVERSAGRGRTEATGSPGGPGTGPAAEPRTAVGGPGRATGPVTPPGGLPGPAAGGAWPPGITGPPTPSAGTPVVRVGIDRPAGRLVAVWGPTGAPGRTTVAVTLAAELARHGLGAVIADADTYGPSVAQSLALLDESAGLAAAARAANQGTLDVQRLARLAPVVAPGLRVLTGIPRPNRWPELRPSALESVWQVVRQLADWTVVDCGFGLEAEEEVSFDLPAPRRNGATLCTLAAADVVLVVGSADAVGMHRLVRGLQDLRDVLRPDTRLRVVVTRVRESSVGPAPHRKVAEALARFAGVHDPVLVPDDRPACDAALLSGRTLTEIAPNSPARQVIAGLAAELAGLPAPVPRCRRSGAGAVRDLLAAACRRAVRRVTPRRRPCGT